MLQNKFFLIGGLILISLMINSVSAFNFPSDSTAVTSSSFKYNEEVTLYQMCSNCSYVNITSVTYPSSLVSIINEEMAKNGNDYTYSFTDTTELGEYKYNVCGDKNSVYQCEVLTFSITPSGSNIGLGEGFGLASSIFLIIIIAIIFLVIAVRSKNMVMKVSFYTFTVVIFIIAILYTVIIIQQTMYGFDSILVGIESFWFVIKSLITVGIVAFIIVIFLILLKAWKIKRGLYDE